MAKNDTYTPPLSTALVGWPTLDDLLQEALWKLEDEIDPPELECSHAGEPSSTTSEVAIQAVPRLHDLLGQTLLGFNIPERIFSMIEQEAITLRDQLLADLAPEEHSALRELVRIRMPDS